MTPEIETAQPAAGRNFRDNSDATTTKAPVITSKSNVINGGQGRGQGGCGGRGYNQGHNGRGRKFNRPLYTPSIQN